MGFFSSSRSHPLYLPVPLTLLFLSSVWFSPRAVAQWNPLNPVQSTRKSADGLTVFLESGALRLQICTDSIVRVLYSPQRDFPAVAEYVVSKTDWPKANFDVAENEKEITLTAAKLKVVVTKKDSSIVFYDAAGKKLAAENDRIMTPVEVNGEKTYHLERFTNMWDTQEAFYGLGQHQGGVFNWRGESVDIVEDSTNISIPLLVSSNGYGIFWNNPSRSRFNNRFVHALYISSEVAEQMDYYFIYGPDFDRIIGDWFWWNTMGEPVWNRNYPDPQGMVEELHRENIRLMVSVWPYFRPGSPVYDDMAAKGLFIDRTRVGAFHPAGMALYDAFNPEARSYYWNLMDGALFKIGVDAWWLDTTEPETEGREESVLLHNKVLMDGKPASGARYANLFPLMTTSAVYQGQRAASDQKRVFILSRSAFAGAQRNATAVWSGDVNPNWETFRRQIPAGLNYSLAGNPLFAHLEHRRSVSLWAVASGKSSHRTRRNNTPPLSSQRQVVQLLDRRIDRGRALHRYSGAPLRNAAVRPRRLDHSFGPEPRIRGATFHGRDRTARLYRS